ncbi:MAG TPA: 50S ribosomal protein L11 methyltransferase, partial [Arcobacter sp.]|nr:50S ribosomal protein L11 methyltransferase [Arcobacter sp.]
MKDKYYELTLTLKDDFVEFIADFIANIAGDGVEIGRGKIIVRSENSVEFIKDAVNSLIGSLGSPIDIEYKIEQKDNEDWIQKYKSSIEPIEVGKFY